MQGGEILSLQIFQILAISKSSQIFPPFPLNFKIVDQSSSEISTQRFGKIQEHF